MSASGSQQAATSQAVDASEMNSPSASAVASADRPVFVLGERAAAIQLVQALGDTPSFTAVPLNRLLADLASAADRCAPAFGPIADPVHEALRPARWYQDVLAAQLQASGKARTVEFSGLSVLRLCGYFPDAQFVVVRQLKRAMPRSRRFPPMEGHRILQVDSERVNSPETVERVLAFLGEPTDQVVIDLSDRRDISAGR